MTRTTKLSFVLAVFLCLLALSVAAIEILGRQKQLPRVLETPDFSLVDQNNQPFARSNLNGNVWIADFIFTRCGGPCPMMSAAMSRLQADIPNAEVKFVSFSVDPEYDTPEILKAYAKAFNADESRWSFCTGQRRTIYGLAAGMKLAVAPASGDAPILHSTRFILIDRDGWVRGYYDGNDPSATRKLIADANRLAIR